MKDLWKLQVNTSKNDKNDLWKLQVYKTINNKKGFVNSR
jgi:hypothetical protein